MPIINAFFCRVYRSIVHGQQGFSLVEILVALAVLGILTTAIAGIFVGGSGFLHAGGNRTEAVKMAQERIEEIKSQGFMDIVKEGYAIGEPITEDYGEIEGHADYRRTTIISPEDMDVPGEVATLKGARISVTVCWNGRENPHHEMSFEQQALLFNR